MKEYSLEHNKKETSSFCISEIAKLLCSVAFTKHMVSTNQQAQDVSLQNLVSSLHCEGFHFCLHDNSSSQ